MEPGRKRGVQRRAHVRRSAMAAVLAATALTGCAGDRSGDDYTLPANVVLIVIDTLRPDYLGCYGDERGLTPHIDQLARDGVLFEATVCPSAITGPSHATLFTSLWPSEHGIVNNGRGRLPKDALTMTELIADRGYITGAVVSIAPVKGDYGFRRGFMDYEDGMEDTWILPAQEILPRAIHLLDGMRRPLFLWVHFSDPHEPYDAHGLVDHSLTLSAGGQELLTVPTSTYTPTIAQVELPARECDVVFTSDAPFHVRNFSLSGRLGKPTCDPEQSPKYRAVEEFTIHVKSRLETSFRMVLHASDAIGTQEELLERYAREVAYVDRYVGAVLDTLRARGLYDESLIVLASDHGEDLRDHGYVGHVETLYDSMMRVPLIFKLPAGQGPRPGTRREDVASLADVMPTILAQLEITAPEHLRGRDLFGSNARRRNPRLFMETHPPEAQKTKYGLRGRSFKITWTVEDEAWEFYDLERDPGERENLWDEQDPRCREWRAALEEQLIELQVSELSQLADEDLDDKTREMLRSLGY
jgi:arylsulfatase A-like enzyme